MANNLLSVWGTIGSVLAAILILLVMITVHEFGHYVAGKLLKFKISEFAIGFGPALFKKKRKKSEEVFSVRLLPLGGFCAFAGEDGDEKEDEVPMPEPFESFTAGENAAPMSEERAQNAGMPPANSVEKPKSKKKERLRYSGDGLFTHMPPWKRILVLVAGATMNYLLAVLFIIALFFGYGQSFVEVGGARVSDEYPAELSFQAGDILIKADGRGIYLPTDLIPAVNGKKDGDEVVFTVLRKQADGTRAKAEQRVRLRGVDREGNKVEKIEVANSSDYSTVYRALGVATEVREDGLSYYILSTANCQFGFFETVGRSFVYSFKIAGSIFRILGELFTGAMGIRALGGPVTTITTTSQVVASGGFAGFLEITAFIGVNLAVMNLLPIPALDGSKVVFTLIEWIFGRPISRKVEAAIHAVGIVLLFAFAILVDVLQFL